MGWGMFRLLFGATTIVVVAIIYFSWASCWPSDVLWSPWLATEASFCKSIRDVPKDFPSMLVEVFILGSFFAIIGSLIQVIGDKTTARKMILSHIDSQFEQILRTIDALVELSDVKISNSEDSRTVEDIERLRADNFSVRKVIG